MQLPDADFAVHVEVGAEKLHVVFVHPVLLNHCIAFIAVDVLIFAVVVPVLVLISNNRIGGIEWNRILDIYLPILYLHQ